MVFLVLLWCFEGNSRLTDTIKTVKKPILSTVDNIIPKEKSLHRTLDSLQRTIEHNREAYKVDKAIKKQMSQEEYNSSEEQQHNATKEQQQAYTCTFTYFKETQISHMSLDTQAKYLYVMIQWVDLDLQTNNNARTTSNDLYNYFIQYLEVHNQMQAHELNKEQLTHVMKIVQFDLEQHNGFGYLYPAPHDFLPHVGKFVGTQWLKESGLNLDYMLGYIKQHNKNPKEKQS